MPKKSKKAYELEAFKHFIAQYKVQWDLNQYARENYDEDLEYYLGYRPSNRYPLPYSESFNKLLPKTLTILSRLLNQLYQAGTGDIISVKARKGQDTQRAERVKGLLNYQMENMNSVDLQGGSYYFNMQWMSNAINFGKGIAKAYWRKDERIMPRRIQIPMPKFNKVGQLINVDFKEVLVEQPQVVYDQPYLEVLHNKLCVPHPHYKSIQKMPAFFTIYERTYDYLKQKEKEGVFSNIKDLGWSSTGPISTSGSGGMANTSAEAFAKSIEIDGAMALSDFQGEGASPKVDVLEGYGKYIFPEDENPYEVGSGIKIKGMESEAIIHIGNYKAVLSFKKNKYGYRPFFDIGCYMHPELFWDLGIIRLGKGLQEQYNTLANTRFTNAIMQVNQMLKVNVDSDIDPAALVWKPFGIVPVESMDDVQPLVTPDAGQTGVFREQEQFFDDTLQDITGMYAYNQGATPSRKENVGTIRSLQAMGEARTRLLMMTMDHTGFRPLLKYMMILNSYHLDPKFEVKISSSQGESFTPLFNGDIHTDYDFSARYTGTEPALGKDYRAEKMLQLAGFWVNSPYLQQHQWMKAILELMDFPNTETLLKSPQQLQQEQQQQMQESLVQASIQDQMNANQQGRKLNETMVKELMK